MGTAAELNLGEKIGRKITTVEAVARGREKMVGDLPLVRDASWDAAEEQTGANVVFEAEIGIVREVLPYATVTEVVHTTKNDKKPGQRRVFPTDFPHFRGGAGDLVNDSMQSAGIRTSVGTIFGERMPRLIIHVNGRAQPKNPTRIH